MTAETILKQQVKAYLNIRGILWWWNLAGIGVYPGLSDISCLHNGKFYALELKAPKGKPSPKQEEYLQRVNESGGVGRVIRSLEEVMQLFQS